MIFRKFVVVALFLCLILTGVFSTAGAQDTTDVTFFLTFVPNVQFAPVYVALEKGYFAEAGINLTIEHGDENVGLDLIAAGERQFGIISGEEVIKARANERPVVFVYEWFQQYPVGIVVGDTSGITSINDLTGRKVGIPGRFGASYNGLTALLTANGLKESDIQLDEIGFNAPDVFCVGAVEAAVVYINNEPLQIQQRADGENCNGITSVQVFPVSMAADLVSNGLVTNEQTITENPDLVEAMVGAFDQGLREAINNPAEAYLLSASYVENIPLSDAFKAALETAAAAQAEFLKTDPSRELVGESRATLRAALVAGFGPEERVQFEVLLNTIDLWDADTLGFSDRASWEIAGKTLTDMGFLSTVVDLDKAFTNDFLPSAEG